MEYLKNSLFTKTLWNSRKFSYHCLNPVVYHFSEPRIYKSWDWLTWLLILEFIFYEFLIPKAGKSYSLLFKKDFLKNGRITWSPVKIGWSSSPPFAHQPRPPEAEFEGGRGRLPPHPNVPPGGGGGEIDFCPPYHRKIDEKSSFSPKFVPKMPFFLSFF